MKPKNHSTYESFVQMNTADDVVLTDDIRKHMSGPWRLWTAVVYRMNNWGHAPFRTGELAEKVCGTDSPSNRAMVHRWMKSLGEMGWIKPPGKDGGSTQLCVIVSQLWMRRDAGRASNYLCSEPGHFGGQKVRWPDTGTESDSGDSWDAAPPNGYEDSEYVSTIASGYGTYSYEGQPENDPWVNEEVSGENFDVTGPNE